MLLNEPGLIGPMQLKNRIIMAPMGTNYGTTDASGEVALRWLPSTSAQGGVSPPPNSGQPNTTFTLGQITTDIADVINCLSLKEVEKVLPAVATMI